MNNEVYRTRRETIFIYIWGISHAFFLVAGAKVLYFDGANVWEKICAGLVLVFFAVSAYKYARVFRTQSAQTVVNATFPTLAYAYIAEAISLHENGMSLAVLPFLFFLWVFFVINERFLDWLTEKQPQRSQQTLRDH